MGICAYYVSAICAEDGSIPTVLSSFQNIVPISLYISIEFVRTAQAAFIYFDHEIWYAKTNQATLARTWNLSDDLGQIECAASHLLVCCLTRFPLGIYSPTKRAPLHRYITRVLHWSITYPHLEPYDLSAVFNWRESVQGRHSGPSF